MNKGLILRNATANFLGKLTNRAVRILLVPFQIKLLGEEAFGLLGLYAVVSSLLAVLDFGLTITANREIARVAARGEKAKRDTRDLIRTFELLYWGIGITVGCAIVFSAGWLTDNWLIVPTLPRQTVIFCVAVIGVLFVAQWPVSLYQGFLYGLQRQVEANVLAILIELLNGVGSIIILLLYPRVEVFFLWQIVVGVIQVVGHIGLCWAVVREKRAPCPKFRLSILKNVWRYAFGVNMITLLGTLFMRLDSVILSKLLPINFLGYYSLAQRVPTLVGLTSASILPATTPLMVACHEKQDWEQLRRIYHRQARWLAFISAGVAFPIAAFAYPILRIWTQSETVARETWLALTLIAGASALEDTSNSVNQLSLACGFTRPAILVGIMEGLIVTIGTFILAPTLGIVGAASSWALARTFRYVLYPIWTNRLVLIGEAKQWFFDTLPILGLGGVCSLVGYLLYRFVSDVIDNEFVWVPTALLVGISYIGLIGGLNCLHNGKCTLFFQEFKSRDLQTVVAYLGTFVSGWKRNNQ